MQKTRAISILIFILSFFLTSCADRKAPEQEALIPAAGQDWGNTCMQTVGEVNMPVFVVDFADVTYERPLDTEELKARVFGNSISSVAGFYEESSYGSLYVTGQVYRYTAMGKITDYETEDGFEELVMEVLDAYDDRIDFTEFDRNADGVLDCLLLSVPTGGDADFWYGCTALWYMYEDYRVDGVRISNYIISDEQPNAEGMGYFISTMIHEMGHCMGLPDYYKYDLAEGEDWEGMTGTAGYEVMDDAWGDYSMASKIQLGWVGMDTVQTVTVDELPCKIMLPPLSKKGAVVIFPEGADKTDFQSEHFVLEYDTPEGCMAGVVSREESGVRMLHVNAEIYTYEDGYSFYKYEGYSEFYDTSNQGIRVLKLVNDGEGYFKSGDAITYGISNFGWYRADGGIMDPGFSVEIGEVTEEGMGIQLYHN